MLVKSVYWREEILIKSLKKGFSLNSEPDVGLSSC